MDWCSSAATGNTGEIAHVGSHDYMIQQTCISSGSTHHFVVGLSSATDTVTLSRNEEKTNLFRLLSKHCWKNPTCWKNTDIMTLGYKIKGQNHAHLVSFVRGIIHYEFVLSFHTAHSVKQFLTIKQISVLEHPLHLPRMAPCAFFMFLTLKTSLKRSHSK